MCSSGELDGRTGGVLVIKGAVKVSLMVWVGGRGKAESDSRTRGTMKRGV